MPMPKPFLAAALLAALAPASAMAQGTKIQICERVMAVVAESASEPAFSAVPRQMTPGNATEKWLPYPFELCRKGVPEGKTVPEVLCEAKIKRGEFPAIENGLIIPFRGELELCLIKDKVWSLETKQAVLKNNGVRERLIYTSTAKAARITVTSDSYAADDSGRFSLRFERLPPPAPEAAGPN